MSIKTATAVRELVKKAKDSNSGVEALNYAQAAQTLLYIELQSTEADELKKQD